MAEFYDYEDELIARRRAEPGRRPDLRPDRRRGGRRPARATTSCATSSSTSSSAASTRARASSPTRCGCSPSTPTSGSARARIPRARARGGRRGAPLRADHAVHRADHDRRGRAPRRHVPAGHDRAGLRLARQPRRRSSPTRFDITAERDRARACSRSAPASTTASGANLARAEMQEALAFLAERVERDRARRRARVRHAVRDLRPRDAAARLEMATRRLRRAAFQSASSPIGSRTALPEATSSTIAASAAARSGTSLFGVSSCATSWVVRPSGKRSSSGSGVVGWRLALSVGSRLAISTS